MCIYNDICIYFVGNWVCQHLSYCIFGGEFPIVHNIHTRFSKIPIGYFDCRHVYCNLIVSLCIVNLPRSFNLATCDFFVKKIASKFFVRH